MIMIGLDPLAPPLSAPRARVVSCVILEATREARSSRVILRARYAREALAAGCGPVWRSQIRDAQAGEAISSLCFTDHCQTLMTGTEARFPADICPKSRRIRADRIAIPFLHLVPYLCQKRAAESVVFGRGGRAKAGPLGVPFAANPRRGKRVKEAPWSMEIGDNPASCAFGGSHPNVGANVAEVW